MQRMKCLGTACIILGLLMPFSVVLYGQPASSVYDKVKDSVFVVKTFDYYGHQIMQGSCVAIESDIVATNHHVVKYGGSFQVGQGGRFIDASLYAKNVDRDIALLRAPGLQGKPPQIARASDLRVGQNVYAVGAPEGLELTISEGIVSQLRGEKPPYIQTTAPISPGSSGGGLFNDSGQLVGLMGFYVEGGQNLNFALPAEWVVQEDTRLLEVMPKQTETASSVAHRYLKIGVLLPAILVAILGIWILRSRKKKAHVGGVRKPGVDSAERISVGQAEGDRIVTCKVCGSKNRVVGHSPELRPICGHCKASLSEPLIDRAQRAVLRMKPSWVGLSVTGLAILLFLLFGQWANHVEKPLKNATSPMSHLPPQPSAFDQPLQPLPPNGAQVNYFLDEAVAPLTIQTKQNAGHYFVKVVEWATGTPVLTVFVRSGQSVNTKMPCGSYRIKYAVGEQWYGEKYLFGPRTCYSMADGRFDFGKTATQVSGYTVELFLQPNGNLPVKQIKPEDF